MRGSRGLDHFSPQVILVGVGDATHDLVTRLDVFFGSDKHVAVDFRCVEEAAANSALLINFVDQDFDFLADFHLQACGADGLLVGHEAVPAILLDRKALPAPGLDSVVVREYEAPQGDTEMALASLWAELLNVERVGRHDNFFELGGHSLLAVSLMGRMRRLGLSADVKVLFGQPTLSALAAALVQAV